MDTKGFTYNLVEIVKFVYYYRVNYLPNITIILHIAIFVLFALGKIYRKNFENYISIPIE